MRFRNREGSIYLIKSFQSLFHNLGQRTTRFQRWFCSSRKHAFLLACPGLQADVHELQRPSAAKPGSCARKWCAASPLPRTDPV